MGLGSGLVVGGAFWCGCCAVFLVVMPAFCLHFRVFSLALSCALVYYYWCNELFCLSFTFSFGGLSCLLLLLRLCCLVLLLLLLSSVPWGLAGSHLFLPLGLCLWVLLVLSLLLLRPVLLLGRGAFFVLFPVLLLVRRGVTLGLVPAGLCPLFLLLLHRPGLGLLALPCALSQRGGLCVLGVGLLLVFSSGVWGSCSRLFAALAGNSPLAYRHRFGAWLLLALVRVCLASLLSFPPGLTSPLSLVHLGVLSCLHQRSFSSGWPPGWPFLLLAAPGV